MMKKQMTFLFVAFCCMVQTMQAQLIAEWKLQEDMVGDVPEGESRQLTGEEAGMVGWNLSNCYAVNNDSWEEAMEIREEGYAITPPISGLKTNAILKFYCKSADTDCVITVDVVGNGILSESSFSLSKSNAEWYYFDKKYLTEADHNTRLKFSGTAAFKLMAITLREWNFYESFDNVDGTNGVSDFSEPSLLSDNRVEKSMLSNQTGVEIGGVYKGSKCVYIDNSSSYYQVTINASSWGNDAVLSFKAAGRSDGTKSITLTTTPAGILDETPVAPVAGEWTNYKIRMKLKDKSVSSLTLKFEGLHYFLDDVKLAPTAEFSLIDNISNDEILQKRVGEIADVKLMRTLKKGIWNTLCVPFDVKQIVINEATGYYNTATFKVLDRVENDVFYFTSTQIVPAGTPFLIKLDDYDLVNATFRAVKIKATEPQQTVDANGFGFWGTFNPIELATNGTNAFLAADQHLHVPAAGTNTMNGLRAFFVMPTAASSRAMVRISDDAQSVSLLPSSKDAPTQVLNLLGQPVSTAAGRLPRGCYIVNGRKYIVK